MSIFAVLVLAQTVLTEAEVRFVIWLVAALGAIIIAILGFGGRRIVHRLDADAEEWKAVVNQVAQVAEDHRDEIKQVYARIYEWNKTTGDALAEHTIRFDHVDLRLEGIENRLPPKRKQRPT